VDPQVNRQRSRRDAGLTALFLGFFGACWFGWGGSAAPSGLEPWLNVGGVVALLVALGGAIVAFRDRAAPAALDDRDARRRYTVTVVIEFGLALAGGIVLGAVGLGSFIAAWVAAIVGVHFFPLARILRDRLLVPLGVTLLAVALAALVTDLKTGVEASTVAGTGAGLLLLAVALIALTPTRTPQPRFVQTGPG
jgi:hypothetical protein